ncbi:acyl-CoA synthetase [Nocardioides pacificus]
MAHNIADLFEHAVDAVPDRLCVRCGDRTLTYADVEAEANRLAHFLDSRGVRPGEHVGIYAKNGVEYVVAFFAVHKLRAVAVNVNYRYVEGELDYLFGDADLVALIHDRTYAPLVERVLAKHPGVHTVVAAPDPMEPDDSSDISGYGGVTWADAVAGQSAERDFEERSGDDLLIIYTGGTTGYPKGVMWRSEDYWRSFGGGIDFYSQEPLEEMDQSRQAATNTAMLVFPISPLMHGGGQAAMLLHLFAGHGCVLIPAFDAERIWSIVERDAVNLLFITGDAMARPLIESFEEHPCDASSLFAVASSAAVFSRPVKERWMAAFPHLVLTDSVGASETGFQGVGIQEKDKLGTEGVVVPMGPGTVVLDEMNQLVDPSAVGAVGRLGRGGNIPLGYYKDEAKTRNTFLEVDGRRYSVPGDFARIEEGGRITLLGRGSNCINTGGEKVFPEEVEMALKGHPDVFDVLVLGTEDERFGQRVTALVQPRDGAHIDLESLQAHLRPLLSGYKLPRSLVLVDEVPRHVTGKADYASARTLVAAEG